jgi:hypothetical protein
MALPTNNKNNKQGKGAKHTNQGSKFIQKPGSVKPSGGGVAKKANRTGGTRGS